MKPIPPEKSKKRKGAVMLETALVALVFLAMLIGAFDFAQFLFIHQALVERARFVARWGALTDPTNTSAITDMMLYNQSTDPPAGTSGYLGLTSSNVSVSTPGSGTGDYRLTLLISNYTYSMFSPYIGGSYNGPNISVSIPLGQN